ncbi:MAG: hypothetical protein OEY91_13680 [Nitrospirota bacterium]|nr:hypothetical protein [Nitrospirota bacterium]
MSANDYAAKMTTLQVNVSLPCKIYKLPVGILRDILYMDSKKIVSGEIEVATCEFRNHLFLLSAKIEKSKVVGVRWLGMGSEALCCEDQFWGPVLKAAWKEEGVDIDQLDTSSVTVEGFVKELRNLLEYEVGKGTETKAYQGCFIYMRVFDFGEHGVVVCVYVCGHWVSCIHLKPEA